MARKITATLPAQRRQFLAALTGALVAPSVPAVAASTDRIRQAAARFGRCHGCRTSRPLERPALHGAR